MRRNAEGGMSGTPYQQGNPVTLDATFLTGSTPTDPTAVYFRVRDPDDTLTTYTYGTDPEVTKLSTGVYECALGVPVDAGQYHYEAVGLDNLGNRSATLPGDFYVIPSSVDDPAVAPGPVLGPCRTWINGADIAVLCNADPEADAQQLDAVAVESSMLMWELSGRQFSGLCERTVRPCADPQTNCWPYNWGQGIYPWWGFGFGWGWGWYGPPMGLGGNQSGPLCGCKPLSRVKLAGYPVREIVEVKIDGVVLPATDTNGNPNYRLDGWTWLTRMDDPTDTSATGTRRWPACQDLSLDDTQPGTFSVDYRYGNDPPPLGVEAARQFACELFAALTGGECKIPDRVVKVVRQGLTQERLSPLAPQLRSGQTGLLAVDAFLASVNPSGLRRRPAVYSPDVMTYAPRLGST